MPTAGRRDYSSADITDKGERGHYWSSSPSGSDYSGRARNLGFNSSYVGATNVSYRSSALSARCFKNEYVEPDNTWTVEAGTLGSAGIFHNATL